MKKALKITSVILSFLLVIFIMMEIFIPGLPLYIKIKKEYPKINEKIDTYKYYDTKVPDSFVKKKVGNYYISVPDSASSSSLFIAKSDDLMIPDIAGGDLLNNDPVEYSSSNDYHFDEEDYMNFYKTIKCTPPENAEAMKIFTRDKIDLNMCLRLRGTDRKIYKEFADSKNTVTEIEKLNYFDHNGIKGFICEIDSEKYNSNKFKYYWTIDIYTENNEEVISLFANDVELIKQIIASIEPAV